MANLLSYGQLAPESALLGHLLFIEILTSVLGITHVFMLQSLGTKPLLRYMYILFLESESHKSCLKKSIVANAKAADVNRLSSC